MKYYILKDKKVLFDYGKDNPLLLCHEGTWKRSSINVSFKEGHVKPSFGKTRKGRPFVTVRPGGEDYYLKAIEGAGDKNWDGWLTISTQYSRDLLIKKDFPEQIGNARPNFPFALAIEPQTKGGGCWLGWGVFPKKYIIANSGLWLDLAGLELNCSNVTLDDLDI